MLKVIEKKDFFEWAERGLLPVKWDTVKYGIKLAQDMAILDLLEGVQDRTIAEAGGGRSRTLGRFMNNNTCWNIDRLEGEDGGVAKGTFDPLERVTYAHVFLGDFAPELPESFFDISFSISVIEHLPSHELRDFFRDLARITKPGGISHHAIDFYVADEPLEEVEMRLDDILRFSQEDTGFSLVGPSEVPRPLVFRSHYVSNPDHVMHVWNDVAPALKELRERAQGISLIGTWRKEG